MKRNIIVTGSDGQAGLSMRDIAKEHNKYNFIFTDINDLDITSQSDVEQFFETNNPHWVVNLAAYTNVDKAEEQRELADKINAIGVKNIALASKKCGAALIHISTDYVFDGQSATPLTEEMPTDPINVYGKTKLEGEKNAMLNPAHVILRTSWLYSQYGKNFVKTMLQLASTRTEISVVSDQWGSPTSASDLVGAIMTVIKAGDKGEDVVGIYHYSNEGATCWADFAEHIFTLNHTKCKVNYVSSEEYKVAAKRPTFSLMDKSKFKNKFGVVIPEWEISLEEILIKLAEQ